MFFEQYSHEPSLAVMRDLKHFAPNPSRHVARLAELEPRARHALEAMAMQLESNEWIAGSHCSIADYALYPYTRTAHQSGFDLSEFPSMGKWLTSMERLPRFISVGVDGAQRSVSFADYFGAD